MAKYIIATGGTGGHIFPAVALFQELQSRDNKCLIIADKRFLKFRTHLSQELNYKIIPSASISGNILKKALAAVVTLFGTIAALLWILIYKPTSVISFGGYPTFPTMLAAKITSTPLIIHEQNSVIGRANRFFLKDAKLISLTFPDTKGLAGVQKEKIFFTRNPVKPGIVDVAKIRLKKFSKGCKITLLVLGGSQGAKALSDIVPEAIGLLSEELKARVVVYQQAREEDLDRVRNFYRKHKIRAFVSSFFQDIPARLAETDLVIARGGATTISELVCSCRPGIIIPIPHSNENHQYLNGKFLEDNGAGWVLAENSSTAKALAGKVSAIFATPSMLEGAHHNLVKLSKIKKMELADLIVG